MQTAELRSIVPALAAAHPDNLLWGFSQLYIEVSTLKMELPLFREVQFRRNKTFRRLCSLGTFKQKWIAGTARVAYPWVVKFVGRAHMEPPQKKPQKLKKTSCDSGCDLL